MDLREEARVIREERTHLTPVQLREAHAPFRARYPKLFDMLVDEDNVDLTTLGFMLDRCGVYESQTERYAAASTLDRDMIVAMHLADKYIFNDANRPDADTLERCKEKLRRREQKFDTLNS